MSPISFDAGGARCVIWVRVLASCRGRHPAVVEGAAGSEYGWRMSTGQPRVISVRSGRVRPGGSWLYIWLDTATGEIVHVGGTGFDPELRAYLHLTSDDPQLGRVRATVPQSGERDFDILAFELAHAIDRQPARDALISRLSKEGDDEELTAELREIIDPMVRAVSDYRATLSAAKE